MTSAAPATMPELCNRHYPLHATTALMILLTQGIDLRRVDILADGEHENYKGEVRRQQPGPGEPVDPREKIVLRVGHAGAVDQLPYQFFYGLDSQNATRSADWEERARRLMAPFDAAVVRSAAVADFEKLRFQFGFADLDHVSRFLELFGFDRGEPTSELREALIWAMLMPSFNQWAGNPQQVEKALQCLFDYEFAIIENRRTTHQIPAHLRYRLGSPTERLGCESVIGESFSECDSGYTVVVKRVREEDVRRFLPGQPGRRKLEQVLNICMPGHLEYDIRIEPDTGDGILGHEIGGAYLGYSTYG